MESPRCCLPSKPSCPPWWEEGGQTGESENPLEPVPSVPWSWAWPERGPALPKCLGGPPPGTWARGQDRVPALTKWPLPAPLPVRPIARPRRPWVPVLRSRQAVPRSPALRSPCSSWCPSEAKAHCASRALATQAAAGAPLPRFGPAAHCGPPPPCRGQLGLGLGRPLYLYSYVCTSDTNKCTCCQKCESLSGHLSGLGVAHQGQGKAQARVGDKGARGSPLHGALPTSVGMPCTALLRGSPTPHQPPPDWEADSANVKCPSWQAGPTPVAVPQRSAFRPRSETPTPPGGSSRPTGAGGLGGPG